MEDNGCIYADPFYILIYRSSLYLNRSCFVFAGTPFPSNFRDVVKTIFKRLFRVYAHIYHSHFQKIVSLKEEAHLNTCFKHFILFTFVSQDSLNCLMKGTMSDRPLFCLSMKFMLNV